MGGDVFLKSRGSADINVGSCYPFQLLARTSLWGFHCYQVYGERLLYCHCIIKPTPLGSGRVTIIARPLAVVMLFGDGRSPGYRSRSTGTERG